MIERQKKGQWPDQMRRHPHQPQPFPQGFAHQRDFEIAQIAQTPMRKLGIVCAGGRGEVPHLDQRHRQSAQRRIARGETAGGAAADDQDVEYFAGKTGKSALHARARLTRYLK